MPTILHLDMNSYFATVEQQANPALRGRPVGIVKAEGRGCVIAASVEAKRHGVTTGSLVWEAKRLCPQIVLLPSDMDKYYSLTQGLIRLAHDFSPIVEVFSIDEMFLDVSHTQNLYLGGAVEMALLIKQRVKKQLGEWLRCSIGVSFSRLLAKLAAEMDKPDGLTFLSAADYLARTEMVEVGAVCGIGSARTRYLHQRGIYTLGQARRVSLPADLADLVWLKSTDPLTPVSAVPPAKSVSRTFTTFSPLTTVDGTLKLVRNLTEEAAGKLREMEMKGRTCCLALRSDRGCFWARRTTKTLTNDPGVIFGLLRSQYEARPLVGVRFAGVYVANLSADSQAALFDRRDRLLRAADIVNQKYGGFTLYPASLLGGALVRPEVTGYLGDKWYRLTRTSVVVNNAPADQVDRSHNRGDQPRSNKGGPRYIDKPIGGHFYDSPQYPDTSDGKLRPGGTDAFR